MTNNTRFTTRMPNLAARGFVHDGLLLPDWRVS